MDVVHMIFAQDNQVLLGYRENTRHLSDLWGLPSGRVEPKESPAQAAIREAEEEVGVKVTSLSLICDIFDENEGLCHYVFYCQEWQGDLCNAEPHLCREIRWYPFGALPSNCTSVTYPAIPHFVELHSASTL